MGAGAMSNEQKKSRIPRTNLSMPVAIALLAVAAPAVAHHSFSAVFDRGAPITLTGKVTKVEWMNPHTWFYIDVTNESGAVESWGFEMGSPNALVRRGWRNDSLRAGQVVTVAGFRARERPRTGAARSVTLASGEQLFGAQDESK
jgi:Family of unknown function (DUF6152)